ncbi:hypothetical protein BDZ94DRAFT_1248634 [Collybia nuda]|uniref:Uncharacterized protein n=1 Tax=Collybia nuda TaxID=64659 RepID=A0A9P6CPG4_9AGAR|nr:hypothetical protein BDZ94DRAFT_1248634 [Collybia nuda]
MALSHVANFVCAQPENLVSLRKLIPEHKPSLNLLWSIADLTWRLHLSTYLFFIFIYCGIIVPWGGALWGTLFFVVNF